MLYFAYGSNLDFTQMRQRCPSVQFVAVAKLPKHRLDFTRKSTTRDCGVADVVPDETTNVWGVVYDIAETDFGKLDSSEGFRPGRPLNANAYNREQCHVSRDGSENQPLVVWIYVANRQDNPPLPNAAYKKLIVEGAKHWHLPADYIAQLERIEVADIPQSAIRTPQAK
jgi:gamma-glutamylcyclotransferase (GGCT)/AIG2-like uncharacterized protein YtfP